MIRVIIILFLLTKSVNAECKYSATADVINDKLVNKKETYVCKEEKSFFVRNWYPPPDSTISKENSSLLYFSFNLFMELFISFSVKFLFSLSEKAFIISDTLIGFGEQNISDSILDSIKLNSYPLLSFASID